MTTPAFVSRFADVVPHDSGWWQLSSGRWMTRFPLWDRQARLFARLGPGTSQGYLSTVGIRLPTIAEYDQLHASAFHIQPVTLPTAEMLRAAGVPKPWFDSAGADTPAMRAYRAANMQTRAWSEIHDREVFARLKKRGWNGEPVANAGKHWAQGGLIYGWWLAKGGKIQGASAFHRRDPTYTDYATTFHAVTLGGEEVQLPPSPVRPAGGTMRPRPRFGQLAVGLGVALGFSLGVYYLDRQS